MKKSLLIIFTILLAVFVSAADFTPSGNINGRNLYNIYNFKNINSTQQMYANGSQVCTVANGVCGSAGSDGNNYTSSISFTGTATKTLNLARIGMTNLTAAFTDIYYIYTDLLNFTNSPGYINGSYANATYLLLTDQRYNESARVDSVNATAVGKASPGSCGSGQAVQNTTTSGVQCFTPAGSSYTAGNGLILTGTQFNVSATTCGTGNYSYYNGTSFLCRSDTTGSGTSDGTGGWTNTSTYTNTLLNVNTSQNYYGIRYIANNTPYGTMSFGYPTATVGMSYDGSSLWLQNGGSSLLQFSSTQVLFAINLAPYTDNSYDLGTTSNRVRDGYFSRDVRIQNNLNVTNVIHVNGSKIFSNSTTLTLCAPGAC